MAVTPQHSFTGQLTLEGLDAYLQSNDNHIIGIEKYAEHQDMGFPMSFYFINSSHNTYLTGKNYYAIFNIVFSYICHVLKNIYIKVKIEYILLLNSILFFNIKLSDVIYLIYFYI